MAGPITVPLGPATVNLTGVRAGDRNLILATVMDKNGPIDLTGRTLAAQARGKVNDPDPPAMTAEVTVVDAVTGQISIRWPGDQVTAVLGQSATWSGAWDLQVESPGEDPVTICAGKISCEMDVTRVVVP